MTDDTEGLRLLDDLPVGQQGDSFQHALYAEMLASVFMAGRPGRCVGLFGKWGQGKSSVVRLLREKLNGRVTVVTFNAWKSSGDSVRRQLLLHVLRMIAPAEVERIEASCSITIPERILATAGRRHRRKKGLLEIAKDWRTLAAGALLPVALLFFCSGLVLAVLGLAWDTPQSSRLLQFAQGSLFPAGIALAVYIASVLRKRYFWHLSIDQPVPEDQRLKYPEQFQTVFATHASRFCSKKGDLIVVVDDLDRCNATTVAEALAAIRQFTADALREEGKDEQKDFSCQFLVPCDEMQVVLALELAGHDAGSKGASYHDYKSEELLRKFFDVTIRMHELHQDDLVEYAANLAETIDLNRQEARELISLVGPHDPRLVKQLLNALALSHDRVKRAHECKALPALDELLNLEATERLLVALRETVPRMYARIAKDPSLLDNRSALAPTQPDDKESKDELERTLSMISAAGRVSAETAEILIHGKLPKSLHGVRRAGSLIRAVRRYDQRLFDEVLSDLDKSELQKVRRWLAGVARRVRESSATGLRQLLGLLLGSSAKDNLEKQLLAPCLEVALGSETHLAEALADHPNLSTLEAALGGLSSQEAARVSAIVLDNFLSSEGESDGELSFLLRVCSTLEDREARKLRTWIEQGTAEESSAQGFIARLASSMPDGTARCFGFAPSAAASAAAHLRHWATSTGAEAPGSEAVTTFILVLVGDNEEHTCNCIQRILPLPVGASDASVPEGGTELIATAWDVLSELLDRATDACVERAYGDIEQLHDQGRFSASEMHIPLAHLGQNVFRISEEQQVDLASKVAFRLSKEDPQSTSLLDVLGPPPVDETTRSAWQRITSEAGATYLGSLARRPALAQQGEGILRRMHNFRWPVEEAAEELLMRKLRAADSNINNWLDVLHPLLGNRRRKLREKVLECLVRGHNPGSAMIVGVRVLWHSKVDKLSVEGLAEYFASANAPLAQMTNNWNAIREKPGIGGVVECIQSILAKRNLDLHRDECGLRIVARELDHLDIAGKRSFLDDTVWELLHSPNIAIRQKGFEIALTVPQISKKLHGELQDSKYRGQYRVPAGCEPHIGEILNKPLI